MPIFESAGLSIESEIDLPGLHKKPLGKRQADLEIKLGIAPNVPKSLNSTGAGWEYDGESVWVRVENVGVFHVPQHGPIIVELSPLATPADAALYLVGTILGIALHLRNKIVVHASAVLVADQAVLFCGASGAGKSTIASALEGRGYTVLSDDLCALDVSDSEVFTYSDGRLLKLWQSSLDGLKIDHRKENAVSNRLEKFYVSHDTKCPDRVPISRIYFLYESNSPDAFEIVNLRTADAAAHIFANAYRPGLIKLLRQEALYLQISASLSSQSELYKLSRIKDFSQLATVLDRLEEHWSM
ncbi:hypothetical protein L0664_14715 [Octadecabacter sp. G9-8]|uniref:HPr kinase/phosphorylase C-terminal domain-containing protein n=1 Tax=Octadecabacter dasysiphoniae TaxID=2909341 RepID=A0ABS9D127_9RHOB|nr:hypothetical protein [Octadecabacter dasysiphoniae]MCF2872324.1 hypothetical protein [Octadecabacter dasysiphoniae]